MTVSHNMISSRNMQISSPLKFNIPAPMGKIWLSNCKMLWYMIFFFFFALSLLFFLHIVKCLFSLTVKKNLVSLQGRCGGRALVFYQVNIVSCSSDHFLTDENIFKGQQHNQDKVQKKKKRKLFKTLS